MIIVTGANRQLGRAVVERLLECVPARQIGVSVRDTEQAKELEERGVRVRRGDFSSSPTSNAPFAVDHAATEEVLKASGSINLAGKSNRKKHRPRLLQQLIPMTPNFQRN